MFASIYLDIKFKNVIICKSTNTFCLKFIPVPYFRPHPENYSKCKDRGKVLALKQVYFISVGLLFDELNKYFHVRYLSVYK